METIECKHRTTVKSLGHGVNEEECGVCHQLIRNSIDKYNPSTPVVLRLGRIGEKIVPPNPVYKLQLGAEDATALAAAVAAEAKASRAQMFSSGKPEPPETAPTVRPEDPLERIRWYKANRKQMIDDLLTMGEKAFLKKWEKFDVTSRQFRHLKTDPYFKKKIGKLAAKGQGPTEKTPSPSARPLFSEKEDTQPGLPPLPPWNEEWSPEVQILWLRAYLRLLLPGGEK